ncbi:YihY/virulence factor BrkB family protein [Granulicoccus sp. GXG6511]|uniref:YihY/virulence factor BrkB family protein n=1 Tax=Granulicoccus sp. GXG6511 TaxID=3381351 RepID=UPI003D7EFC67
MLQQTVLASLHYRVTGLAAEVAFFTLLSLPPLVFGLAGSIGFIARRFTLTDVSGFRDQALHYAGQFLTPDTVHQLIAPTLDEVLGSSRFDIVSLGFLIALWSGSRATAVFVDAIMIMYGVGGTRGLVRARIWSFGVYLAFLLGGAITLPLVVAGPRLVERLLPDRLGILAALYWPIVLVATLAVLVTLLHWATPVRHYWRAHVPGAALTLIVWLLGSAALRWILTTLTGGTSIFGPLAAPIALLLWLYLIAFAALVGAALNAAVAKVAPRWVGITAQTAEHVLEDVDEAEDPPDETPQQSENCAN